MLGSIRSDPGHDKYSETYKLLQVILRSVSHCCVCVNSLTHIMCPRCKPNYSREAEWHRQAKCWRSFIVKTSKIWTPFWTQASVPRFDVFDPKHCDAPAAATSSLWSSTLSAALLDLSFGLGSRLSRCDVTRWQRSCHLDMLMTSFCGHTVSQINAPLSCAVTKTTKTKQENV